MFRKGAAGCTSNCQSLQDGATSLEFKQNLFNGGIGCVTPHCAFKHGNKITAVPQYSFGQLKQQLYHAAVFLGITIVWTWFALLCLLSHCCTTRRVVWTSYFPLFNVYYRALIRSIGVRSVWILYQLTFVVMFNIKRSFVIIVSSGWNASWIRGEFRSVMSIESLLDSDFSKFVDNVLHNNDSQ